ncbi:unnamed protein product [Caretta caretta]
MHLVAGFSAACTVGLCSTSYATVRLELPEEATVPLCSQLYSVLFCRTSTFALTIVLGALVFERTFDQGMDTLRASQPWETVETHQAQV